LRTGCLFDAGVSAETDDGSLEIERRTVMFVRVVRASLAPDHQGPGWEQEAARHRERTIAHLRQQPGFLRYTAGVDASRSQFLAITEWDTQEHAQHFTQRADLAQDIARIGIRADLAAIFEVETIPG
jgi:quinol monooxygenase YgiN